MSFTVNEKRRLECLAMGFGQTLSEYIRERVLAESGCEEQVLRFLADQLTATGREARESLARMHSEEGAHTRIETAQEDRDRIVKEVRDSLSAEELEALARFLGFEAQQNGEPA